MLVKLVKRISAWRLPNRGHAKFEEWCALAVLGDLAPEKLTELDLHIAKCGSCRNYLEDATQSSLEAMPAFWDKRKPTVSVMFPDAMRARFLQRLQQSGASEALSPTLEMQLPLGPAVRYENEASESQFHTRWLRALPRPVPALATVILASALLIGGYYVGLRSHHRDRAAGVGPASPQIDARLSGNSPPSPQPQNNAELLLQTVLTDLKRERSLASADRRTLEERLTASDNKLMSLERDQSIALQDNRAAERQLNEQIEAFRHENEALRQKLSERDSILTLLEQHTQDLQVELETARNGTQDKDDQRLAKSQLSDLVTARNLHIVDVYDADSRGHRKPSFGRVFYVEGKSLLFYAYDLQDTRSAQAKVVFHVWGGRAGAKDVTHSLGILHNEDAGQGLWTMTFDDPGVLAQINSVFVTAESASRRDNVPHGKKVLYAYFGSPPNHP